MLVAFALLAGRQAWVHRESSERYWRDAVTRNESVGGAARMPAIAADSIALRAWERRLGAGIADHITADTPFIHKPFTPNDRLRHVRATIDAPAPRTN